MILAVKRAKPDKPGPADEIWKQVDEIKSFYGIREQCLETLLKSSGGAPAMVARRGPVSPAR
jgi:hypothetical protein